MSAKARTDSSTPKPANRFADLAEPAAAATLERVCRMPYGLKGFGVFCGLLGLKLYAFERRMLADYFGGALETVCILPKKNGKSTLLAALALYHVLWVSNARAFIGASSRDQATLIFWQAEQLVNDAGLERVFVVKGGYRVIRRGTSVIRVLAGDANTADGVIPTLSLVDELHRHRDDGLYAVLRDGLQGREIKGAEDGAIITISTAGESMDSPLGRLLNAAYELPGRTRKGAYTYVRGESFALHEWSLKEGEDYEDMRVVARANPAPWKTVESLKKFRSLPSMTLGAWLRFACCIWVEGEEPPIDPKLWDDARGVFEIEEGQPIWAGVSLGVKLAHSAIAVVREVEGVYLAKVEICPEPTYADLEARCLDLAANYQLDGLVYTSRGFQRSADLLEDEGLRVIELPTSDQRMTEASATFLKLLQEQRLRHDGDRELRSHVMSARTKETERGWRFRQDPLNPRPVAGLFALIAALQVMVTDEEDSFTSVGWI